MGHQRHLLGLHSTAGPRRGKPGRLFRRDDQQGRYRDVRGEQPHGPNGCPPVVTATGITGDNSATWNPTITVTVPGGTVAGTYSAVITHSVL